MPETPLQKLSALRFLLMMVDQRLVKNGKMVGDQLTVVLTHPPEKLTWLAKDDPFWLKIKDLGSEYQITVLTELPEPARQSYLVSRANLQTWVETAKPTMEDWERITHWIVKGILVVEREIPAPIKQRLQS